MILESPAKINIGLEVHHKRPGDGYHYISSIFVPIYPGDVIEIEFSESNHLTTENLLKGDAFQAFQKVSESGDLSHNLAWKALEILKQTIGKSFRANLIKRIPTGAGLGGGSSNAGTILFAGAKLTGINIEALKSEALALGADVPFFLNPIPSLVTGTGEIIEPFDLGKLFGVVCFPGIHVDTKLAYKNLKRALQHAPPPRSLSAMTERIRVALVSSRWGMIAPLENHFESVVFSDYPILGQVKRSFLDSGALFASLSGSGSSVYGLVSSPEEAELLKNKMEASFPEAGFQKIQSHPLHQGSR